MFVLLNTLVHIDSSWTAGVRQVVVADRQLPELVSRLGRALEMLVPVTCGLEGPGILPGDPSQAQIR